MSSDNTSKSYDGKEISVDDIPEQDFSGKEVVDMPDFDYSPEQFEKFKELLKSGKVVRNPFAARMKKGYTIIIEHKDYDEVVNVKKSIRKRRQSRKVSVK